MTQSVTFKMRSYSRASCNNTSLRQSGCVGTMLYTLKIVKMKRLATRYINWKDIDHHIESLIKKRTEKKSDSGEEQTEN